MTAAAIALILAVYAWFPGAIFLSAAVVWVAIAVLWALSVGVRRSWRAHRMHRAGR